MPQSTGVAPVVKLSGITAGMVTVAESTQLLESVTRTTYVPATNPVPVCWVPPIGDHEYVNGGVPPVIETEAVVVPSGSHASGTNWVVSVNVPLACTCTWASAVHPAASVTVTVYVPAARLEAVAPEPPVGDQL